MQKITKLRQIILDRNESVLIEVDGGVNLKTIREFSEAGVDVFVAGSAIFESDDYQKAIRQFRKVIIKDLAQN